MDTANEYPDLLHGEFPMLVRLKTAIHIACIDAGGTYFGTEFNDDELQKFFDVNAHRYFAVAPVGEIKEAVDKMQKAVLASIEKSDLKLAVTKRNLDGDLSVPDSWVSADDFEIWCESRGIALGESWFELLKDEGDILSCGVEEMDARRRSNEGLRDYDQSDVEALQTKHDEEGRMSIVHECAALRAELRRLKEEKPSRKERPIQTRERNTLLTIIAALCKDAKFDFSKTAKTAGLIQSTAAGMGVSIGETTIEEHLKKIPDALASRMK